MATITSTSTRITISGDYKGFTGDTGSTTTVIQYKSGNAPASGDAGRFLLWRNTAVTNNWEVRFIESATSSTVTVTDGGFSSAPPNNAIFKISTNLEDVYSALSSVVTKTQNSYGFPSRDFELTSGAFLADVNKNLSTENTVTASGGTYINAYPLEDNCVIQFGRLVGGEGNNSVETIGGCSLTFGSSQNCLLFNSDNEYRSAGPVINFYGCLIEGFPKTTSQNLPAQLFIRGVSATRYIGCISDGALGGRLYSTASELVDTRFSGNLSGVNAFSLGASLTRPINNVFFFQNDTAVKAFAGFQGVFTNTTFADSNTNIINSASASSPLLFTFIDCTTFADSKITDTIGQYKQAKSIKYTITDSSGTGLTGAKVAVYDNTGAIQDAIKNSSSGSVDSINAVFFDRPNGSTSTNKAPFDIRIRIYGKTYLGFQSSVESPINQELRLVNNPDTVKTEAQAAATTGISLNFSTETITITSNHDTQSLYDYYQYLLAQDAQMPYGEDLVRSGDSFNLDDWDMVVDNCTYTGDATTTGTITLQNGAVFNGNRTDQNGTVLKPRSISITSIIAGSRLQIYNTTTSTQVINQNISGTSYTAFYAEGTGYSEDDVIRVRLTKADKDEFTFTTTASSTGWNGIAAQVEDTVYTAIGVDGSTITNFSSDYTNDEVDLTTGGNFAIGDFYAWWKYNLTTSNGIKNFFGGITALDEANFRINTSVVNMYLNNNVSVSYRQTDNRRFFRDTGDGYPVKTPTTSGYGLDVVWRDKILVSGFDANDISAIKAKTDQLNFTGTDIKATLDGETVVTDTASRNASKADVSNLDVAVSTRSTFNAGSDTVTTDTASRNASKADVSGLSTFDHTTDQVTTDTASRNASKADVSGLSTFNASSDTVTTDTASRDASKADVSGLSTFNAASDAVITDTASRNASKADVSGLSTFNASSDTVTTDTASRNASKADISGLSTLTSSDVTTATTTALNSYDAPTKAEMDAFQTSVETKVTSNFTLGGTIYNLINFTTNSLINTLTTKVDTVDTVVDSIETKVDIIDTVVDSVETKVDTLDTVADATKLLLDQTFTRLVNFDNNISPKIDIIDTNVDDIETLSNTINTKVDTIDTNVDDIEAKVVELWKLQGLDINNPMTVTPKSRTTDNIDLVLSGDGVKITTVTRQ